jgi:predicted ATPase/class 3 adenylate cyclase
VQPEGPPLPTGTVTFLFTDIEGSTNLARTLGTGWREVLEQHHRLVRTAIRGHRGIDLRTEGDAFFAVFSSAGDAVAAAEAAQRSIAGYGWPDGASVRLRVGMHTGEGILGGDDYIGLDVHRAARIAAAGHGGQVLLSESTRTLAATHVPHGMAVRDLGRHRLKDFDEPQSIYQLLISGLPDEFPPLRTLEIPTNLPVSLTTFVGRQGEVAALEGLLGQTRLITVAGPGGSGKTRLTLEVARRRIDAYPDGVFFIDLSLTADPEIVPSAILHALGAKEQAGRHVMDTLASHLAERHLLLVLDNFEQIISASPVVGEILRAAPHVTIVATSRIPLGLAGERELPVPPLPVPDERADLDALKQSAAVTLFRDRARAVRPSFEVTRDNAEAIARICGHLDGLPLAIELAAAQLRVFAPSELLDRLEEGLALRTQAGNVPERHRTLWATIDWSYRLLDDAERQLLARLSVFAGGAVPAAAEAVGNPSGDRVMDTFDTLDSLLRKSFLRRDDSEFGSRFTMLETIREHVRERLRSDFDLEATAGRHADFFLQLAEKAEPELRGEDQQEWFERLAIEHGNLRAALRWAIDIHDGGRALRLAGALWHFWRFQGDYTEGRARLGEALAIPSEAPPGARAKALWGAAWLAFHQEDLEEVEALSDELRAGAESDRDPISLRNALTLRGMLALAQERVSDALQPFEEALQICRDEEAGWLLATSLLNLGTAAIHAGQFERAETLLGEAADRYRDLGDQHFGARVLEQKGYLALVSGDVAEGRSHFVASVAAFRDLDDRWGLSEGLEGLSAILAAQGEPFRAARLAGTAEALRQELGVALYPFDAAITRRYLDSARVSVDPQAWTAAWEEGRAMPLDEAVAHVLVERASDQDR